MISIRFLVVHIAIILILVEITPEHTIQLNEYFNQYTVVRFGLISQ